MPHVLPLILTARHQGRIHPALDTVRAVLSTLGNPQESFQSVALAGTNGKGSTAAMLERILAAHGLSTGLYTSPHLVRIEERCRIDGHEVSSRQLENALEPLRDHRDLSFFETVTVAALLLFADHGVHWAVLEAGMGGRWDATRAANPSVVGFTNVGTDHAQWLGDNRTAIAAEKGALATNADTAVLGPGVDEAIAPHLGVAHAIRADDIVAVLPGAGQDVVIELAGERFTAPLPLLGRHQLENVALAVALAHEILRRDGLAPINPAAVQRALSGIHWPGRLAQIEVTGRPVLVDGAHNLEAAQALARHLGEATRPYHLLFSCLEDKPANAMAAVLRPVVDRVAITTLDDPRSASIETLSAAFPGAQTAADPLRALELLPDPVVAAGSLRLVGHLLEHVSGQRGRGPQPK